MILLVLFHSGKHQDRLGLIVEKTLPGCFVERSLKYFLNLSFVKFFLSLLNLLVTEKILCVWKEAVSATRREMESQGRIRNKLNSESSAALINHVWPKASDNLQGQPIILFILGIRSNPTLVLYNHPKPGLYTFNFCCGGMFIFLFINNDHKEKKQGNEKGNVEYIRVFSVHIFPKLTP